METNLSPFTVLAFYEDSGQIVSHHVYAKSGTHAFMVVASEIDDTMTFVAAISGHVFEGKGIDFPGDGCVDAETVLEQPDVFGGAE